MHNFVFLESPSTTCMAYSATKSETVHDTHRTLLVPLPCVIQRGRSGGGAKAAIYTLFYETLIENIP